MPGLRFAPPNPTRIADRPSGLNAVRVRSHNDRLVLSILPRNGGMSRKLIGEQSGLSAQTVSVIVRSLEQEGLLASGVAEKGRVGPPTVPVSLNPQGVYAIGISVGFRKTDVVLIDFVGNVISFVELRHDTAGHHYVHPEIFASVKGLISGLPKKKQDRVAGIGLSLPDGFEDSENLSALQSDLEASLGLELFIQNDVTAAAAGESMFGAARSLENYVFFYIGARVHSRLILNHQILRNGISAAYDVGLLDLERLPGANTASNEAFWKTAAGRADYADALGLRMDRCAALLREKVDQARQFVDVNTVVVSSHIPRELVEKICRGLPADDSLSLKSVIGEVSHAPKAVGAASLAFSKRFLV